MSLPQVNDCKTPSGQASAPGVVNYYGEDILFLIKMKHDLVVS